ncbi:MAG: hypothetical protein P8X74_22110 [Reinekea sp.]
MDINKLLMLSSNEIDFDELETSDLEQLIGNTSDLFVKTEALGELFFKDRLKALSIAISAWNEQEGDKFYLAQSLSIILRLDRKYGLKILRSSLNTCDKYILNAVSNLVVDDFNEYANHSDILKMIKDRVIAGDIDEYDEGYVKKFLEDL